MHRSSTLCVHPLSEDEPLNRETYLSTGGELGGRPSVHPIRLAPGGPPGSAGGDAVRSGAQGQEVCEVVDGLERRGRRALPDKVLGRLEGAVPPGHPNQHTRLACFVQAGVLTLSAGWRSKVFSSAAKLKDRAASATGKDGGKAKSQMDQRGLTLGGWLAAVVERWGRLAIVHAFLANDGSWNEIADSVLLRALCSPADDGDGDGSSLSGRLQSCTIERSLCGPTAQVCAPPGLQLSTSAHANAPRHPC